MKLVILDPGFEHSHAHHESVNQSIHNVFSKYGHEVLVVAAKNLEPQAAEQLRTSGMDLLPWFETPCYPKNAEELPLEEHLSFSDSFYLEIVDLYKSQKLDGTEHLLFHTGYSFHYYGLSLAMWRLRHLLEGKLLICAMFHPGARLSPGTNAVELLAPVEYLRHRLATRMLGVAQSDVSLKIELATSSQAYQSIYQKLWNKYVSVHPAICYRPVIEPTVSAEGQQFRKRVLLYLGGVKSNKGFEFSAQLGAMAARKLPEIQFIFHFNDQFPGSNAYELLIHELESAGSPAQNVEIVRGNLSNQAYDELLSTCDVYCTLYDPVDYQFKSSGVLWDMLRFSGKKWLVTKKTWLRDELKQLGVSHSAVTFGEIESALAEVERMTQEDFPTTGPSSSIGNDFYRSMLMRPFGEWVNEQLFDQDKSNPRGRRSSTRPSVLVIRTNYGHFGEVSGPGGFVPFLREMGFDVVEKKVNLGNDGLGNLPDSDQEMMSAMTSGYITSYQPNSIAVETEIQREAHQYDIVHFVDGEHCGLLSALFREKAGYLGGPKLVATFHQPRTILKQIVKNPSFLNHFDLIQLMTPDQANYFTNYVSQEKLICVPHGVAEEIMVQRPLDSAAGKELSKLSDLIKRRKVLLTVGNWLRDFDSLIATATKLRHRNDIMFVIVSKNLELDIKGIDNVLLLNEGISDDALHWLYREAELLFLPLLDGAANNAILEAMAIGLPIATTDLPAIHFYTSRLARVAEPDPDKYAKMLETFIDLLSDENARSKLSLELKNRATELNWKNVSLRMVESLYRPCLNELIRAASH